MTVRFVMGRSGVGKTHHCLSAIRGALRESALDGPKLILLVPEQISLEMERSLLSDPAAPASHRAEVLSFRRLAVRILASCGDGGRSAISAAARGMLLRQLLIRHAGELQYYRRTERFNGFVERLGRTITELIQESVSPDGLSADGNAADPDPVRSLKLHDIQLIYRSYLDSLGPDRLDPSQYLDVARERMPQCEWLRGARVWADGFAGFSRQERLMFAGFARLAGHVDVTALVDGEVADSPSDDLFARTRRMMAELSAALVAGGVVVAPPLTLRGMPRRFGNSASLAQLESHLFEPAGGVAARDGGVTVVRACDRRTEIEWVTAGILELVARTEKPLRYRDIAVIARDLEPYHALVTASFRARNIPHFVDRRRSIGHHPLIELIRGLIHLAASDYSIESVRSILKSGLLDIVEQDCDELENAVLAIAPIGAVQWTGRDWVVKDRRLKESSDADAAASARVNRSRRAFVQSVGDWVAQSRSAPAAHGSEWTGRLRSALDHLGAADRIEHWAQRADQDGQVDVGETHRQVWRDVDAFFDDLAGMPRDAVVNLDELSGVIDAGLGQLTLGLAPPMLDQVLVGQIERSRQPDIRIAFVIGANDGAFPAVPGEDAIINDDDREWLERRGVFLNPPRRRQVLDESLLFYVAATRASEALNITYCDANESGVELRPSPYLVAVRNALPGLKEVRAHEPFAERADWAMLTGSDVAAHLAYEYRGRPGLGDDSRELRQRWNDLYETVRMDGDLAGTIESAARSLVHDNSAGLSGPAAPTREGVALTSSVSRLETFAACPFKHFAQYRLDLKKRALAPLDVPDVGTLHHAVLERLFQTIVDRNQPLQSLDDSELREVLSDSASYVRENHPLMSALSNARDRYLSGRVDHELGRVMRVQQDVARVGAFRPVRSELGFGCSGDEFDGLTLVTPKGRRVLIRGRIDRIDLAQVADEMLGIVIDYKRSRSKRLDLASAYHGLSLQLLVYLTVLADCGTTLTGRPIQPAGAFYVALQNGYRRVDHPGEEDHLAPKQTRHGPRGILDITALPALDPGVSAGTASNCYAVSINKDGRLGRPDQTDAAQRADVARLLAHVKRRLAELADEVLDGNIAVSPFRLRKASPCGWCDYRSVCRFEPESGRMRRLEAMKRTEVFAALSGADAERGNG